MKWSQKLDSSLKNKIGFMYVLEDIRSKSKILLDTVAKQIEFVNFPPDAWRMVNMRCLDSRLKSQPSVFTHKTLSTQAVWTSWCRGGLREVLSRVFGITTRPLALRLFVIWKFENAQWRKMFWLTTRPLFVLTVVALPSLFGTHSPVERIHLSSVQRYSFLRI